MGKIYCLLGKSSSGKDSIFKLLLDDKRLGLKPIVTYTTRPIRDSETNGVEYFFIDDQTMEQYKQEGKVIEFRTYNTVHGKWTYSTINDGQFASDDNYLLITTLEAYKHIRKFFKEGTVVPLYIDVDDGIRLDRALQRERQQTNPKYAELCRRFLADSLDFSEENLKECGIQKYYSNTDLSECVKAIKEDIFT